jgi:hypothetical protein
MKASPTAIAPDCAALTLRCAGPWFLGWQGSNCFEKIPGYEHGHGITETLRGTFGRGQPVGSQERGP